MSLYELIEKLAARRRLLIATVLLSTILSAAFALLSEPVYRARTLLAPGQTAFGSSGLDSLLGQFGSVAALAGVSVNNSAGLIEEGLAVLESRQFTEGFIRDEGLLAKLAPQPWGAWLPWRRGRPRPEPSMARAVDRFETQIRRIVHNRKTGLVTLEIDWQDRAEAAHWANALVHRLNEEMRARAVGHADDGLKYLQRELASSTVVEVREAISRLIEAEVKKRMIAVVMEDYVFRVVDRATPPDADDPVSPRRGLLLASGVAAGAAAGVLLVFVADFIAGARSRRSTNV